MNRIVSFPVQNNYSNTRTKHLNSKMRITYWLETTIHITVAAKVNFVCNSHAYHHIGILFWTTLPRLLNSQ